VASASVFTLHTPFLGMKESLPLAGPVRRPATSPVGRLIVQRSPSVRETMNPSCSTDGAICRAQENQVQRRKLPCHARQIHLALLADPTGTTKSVSFPTPAAIPPFFAKREVGVGNLHCSFLFVTIKIHIFHKFSKQHGRITPSRH